MEENQENKIEGEEGSERGKRINFDYVPREEGSTEERSEPSEDSDNFGLPDVDFEAVGKETFEEVEETELPVHNYEEEEEEVVPAFEKMKEEPLKVKEHTSRYYVDEDNSMKRNNSRGSGRIIFIILTLLVLGGVFYYLYFVEKIFNPKEEEATVPIRTETPAETVSPEDTSFNSNTEPTSLTGTVETISSKTGRYHIIAGSFIDGDNATDFCNKLATQGVSTKIIQPYAEHKGFFKVSIGDFDSREEAKSKIPELQSNFKEVLWVLKY